MRSLIQASLVGVSMLASLSSLVVATPVNNSYIQSSANEIRGFLGGYARPTVYVNQYACREPQLSAMACGPYTISVGTGFLQQQENSYGNYVAKFILAHEWGHSIQFTNNIYRQAPMQELQADCVGHLRQIRRNQSALSQLHRKRGGFGAQRGRLRRTRHAVAARLLFALWSRQRPQRLPELDLIDDGQALMGGGRRAGAAGAGLGQSA